MLAAWPPLDRHLTGPTSMQPSWKRTSCRTAEECLQCLKARFSRHCSSIFLQKRHATAQWQPEGPVRLRSLPVGQRSLTLRGLAQPAADPQRYPWMAERAQDAADLLTSWSYNQGLASTKASSSSAKRHVRWRSETAAQTGGFRSRLGAAPLFTAPFLLLASDSRAHDCARHRESESQQRCQSCARGTACCP